MAYFNSFKLARQEKLSFEGAGHATALQWAKAGSFTVDSSLPAMRVWSRRGNARKIESFRRPELNFTELPAISGDREFGESPEIL